VPLVPLELDATPVPLPSAAAAFLASAQAHIEAWFQRLEHQSGIGFIPSDHELVYAALAALRRTQPDAIRLLEWGSGFGAVTGLAAGLGFEAHGIEIDGKLVASSRELLAAHRLQATIAHGSFVPPDVDTDRFADLETRTVLDVDNAYDELGRDLDDFDVVFAYPWPTEEAMYCDWFRRRADHGAVLLTYSRLEGMRAYRKLARHRERRR
jgi:hypothetical protein